MDYVRLMKPRVMSLVVFTALVGLVAAPVDMHPFAAAVAVLAVALGSGAAGALNMWYDADIDALMARTVARPVPAGLIAPADALGFGLIMSVMSVTLMALAATPLAAALLAFSIFFYAVDLHDVAEALDGAEHRHRRRRRRFPAGDRLGRRHGQRPARCMDPVRPDLPLDAAALLGAVAVDLEGIRPRRRADAAGDARAQPRPAARS